MNVRTEPHAWYRQAKLGRMHLFAFDSALGCTAVVVDGRVVLPPIQAARQPNIGERLAHALPEEGLAQFIDTNGRVVCELNAFMTFVRSDGVSLKSANHYARDLQVFARYLQDLHNKSLLHATSADIGAYRRLRREGPARLRLASSSWKRASIRDEGLLDYAEIEAIINVAPRALTSWQEAVASTSSPRVPLREWLALFDTIFDDAMRSPPTPDLYCCLSSKGLMNLSPVDQSPRTEL